MPTQNSVNAAYTIGSGRECANTAQPCFHAYNNSTQSNVQGTTAVAYTYVFDTEVFDQGSNFNTGTYTFTSPVDGNYVLGYNVALDDINVAAHTGGDFSLITSNRYYVTWSISWTAFDNASGEDTIAGTFFCDMDAADTAFVLSQIHGASTTIDFLGGANQSFFYGKLEC